MSGFKLRGKQISFIPHRYRCSCRKSSADEIVFAGDHSRLITYYSSWQTNTPPKVHSTSTVILYCQSSIDCPVASEYVKFVLDVKYLIVVPEGPGVEVPPDAPETPDRVISFQEDPSYI